MIYFLVNNDYQLFDARRHAEALCERGLTPSLVEVPHSLQEADRGQGFKSVLTLATPLRSHRWLGAWLCYFASVKEVERALRPQRDDVLFIYTEYELLNHFIVLQFKRAGARVYLLEDGGVGTYLPFSLPGDEPLSCKERVIAAMTRCLPGLGKTQFHKVNGVVFPWLEDKRLDGLCLYRPLEIVRSLPVFVLRRIRSAPVEPRRGRVIFLNERMYDDYQTAEQYLERLQSILASLAQGFDEVFFKFHPREEAEWKDRIRALLASQPPSVRIVECERAIEALVEDYRPEVIASYFSTALLNLDGTGIEPMFLYQLLPELASQKVFVQLTALLTQWNYRFVTAWGDARSGYRSGMTQGTAIKQVTVPDLVTMGGTSLPREGAGLRQEDNRRS